MTEQNPALGASLKRERAVHAVMRGSTRLSPNVQVLEHPKDHDARAFRVDQQTKLPSNTYLVHAYRRAFTLVASNGLDVSGAWPTCTSTSLEIHSTSLITPDPMADGRHIEPLHCPEKPNPPGADVLTARISNSFATHCCTTTSSMTHENSTSAAASESRPPPADQVAATGATAPRTDVVR